MWFEERSWSNLRMSEVVEEWRDLWTCKVEFLFAAIAYVFATTNFLNLPKMILDNGGLAFVAAYGTSLLVLVLPTIVLELAVGQLTGRAPVMAFFNLSPVFKGIGVAQVLFTLVVLSCMTKFLAWLLLYLYNLFWTIQASRPGLPWLNCKNFPEFIVQPCREAGSLANFTHAAHTKLSSVQAESTLMQFMGTLERSSNAIDDFGEFQYWILGAQGVVWIVVFIAICFGVRWLGKVVSGFVMLGFSLMLMITIRACLLDGLMEILNVYWRATDWRRLQDYHMWKNAVEQSILATGIGFGAFITLGSYSKRNNNLVCDSFLIVITHALFSMMQVLVVIGLVGYISLKTGLQPSELLDQGEAQMWHVLAYFSYLDNTKLFTGVLLGAVILILLNVFFVLSLSVLSTLEDALGEKWSRCFPRFVLALFTCVLVFGMSLYFSTQAGKHAYELATGFIKYITIFVILSFELFATAWFYCAHRLGMDLHTMLRTACCWCLGHFILYFTYLLPAVPAAIAVLNAMNYSFDNFSDVIRSWPYSEYVGAAIAIVPLLPIPLYFIGALLKACCCRGKSHRSKGQRLKKVFTTRLQRNNEKSTTPPRYTNNAPGYLLLPQAPLAEPEDA